MIVGDKNTNLNQIRAQIGMVFHNFEIFPHITVIENINLSQLKILRRNATDATSKFMHMPWQVWDCCCLPYQQAKSLQKLPDTFTDRPNDLI